MYKMYYDDLITEIETIYFKDGIYTIFVSVSEHIPYETPCHLDMVKLKTNNIEDWNSKEWKIKTLLEQGIVLV